MKPPAMDEPSSDAVVVEKAGHVATVTLNRPGRLNAIDLRLAEALVQSMENVAADADVLAVIITGRGRAFCAGGDLLAMSEHVERAEWQSVRGVLEAGRDVVRALRTMRKVAIAAVNGPALGAGASLALACDVRIASNDAVFGLPFTRLGLHPDWGATYFLPRIVGVGRAMDLLLSGRTVDAVEAERVGIFNRIVPAPALMAEAQALALALIGSSAEAIGLAKQSVEHSLQSTLDSALETEVQQQLHCFETDAARQAIAAFVSRARKQKPD